MSHRPSRHPPEELPFKVEEWSLTGDTILQVAARANNLLIARAAFEAAVKLEPSRRFTLRIGIRLIEQHEPAAPR